MTSTSFKGPTEGEVPFRIELAPALAGFAGSPHVRQPEGRLEAELDALLDRIDLVGSVRVEVVVGATTRLARLQVHGRPLLYPPDLMRRAWLAVAPAALRNLPDEDRRAARPGFAAEWLCAYADTDSADFGLVAAFLERLAAQAVVNRPSCLLGAAQLEEYGASVQLRPADLAVLLGKLLDLGVSIGERKLIGTVVREGEALRRPLEDTIEAAFTELRPHQIEIVVHPATLAELIGETPARDAVSVYDPRIDERRQQLFGDFERAFFATFGFLLPSLLWAPSAAQAERTIAVRIGTWRSLSVPMAPAGSRLVLAPTVRLEGIEATSTFDPVSGLPCSIVATEYKEDLERAGLVTWGPVDFALVLLGAELSLRVGTLLGMEEIEYQLAQLPVEPDQLLTDTSRIALTRFSLGDLTRVMRALVSEHLSMLDLSGLLERLVQYDTVEIDYDLEEPLVEDEQPAASTNGQPAGSAWRLQYAFLRRRLKPYLTYFHAGDELRIQGYSVDPAFEELVRGGPDERDDDRIGAFRDAVSLALSSLAPSAAHVILTTTETRLPIRTLLAAEFPDVPILAYSELTPEVDLDLLGPIAASGSPTS